MLQQLLETNFDLLGLLSVGHGATVLGDLGLSMTMRDVVAE